MNREDAVILHGPGGTTSVRLWEDRNTSTVESRTSGARNHDLFASCTLIFECGVASGMSFGVGLVLYRIIELVTCVRLTASIVHTVFLIKWKTACDVTRLPSMIIITARPIFPVGLGLMRRSIIVTVWSRTRLTPRTVSYAKVDQLIP